jgi:hypothetical protein
MSSYGSRVLVWTPEHKMKRDLRTIGITSLLFGVPITFLLWLRFGANGVLAGVLGAIAWAIFMAIALVPLDLWMTRKLPKDALRPNQSREVEVSEPCNEVFELIKSSVAELPFMKSYTAVMEDGVIYGRTKRSWTSFGEDIVIAVNPLNATRTRVKITSRPRLRYTLLDYGKNYRNIEAITHAIKAPFAGSFDSGNEPNKAAHQLRTTEK